MLAVLARFDYAAAGSPVFIQSFDPNNLQQLCHMTPLPLVQLLEHEIGDCAQIARYAHAIGIAKSLAGADSVAAAHAAGLDVHVWTFRAEKRVFAGRSQIEFGAGAARRFGGEIERYLARGIDGFFTDFPAIGAAVAAAHLEA